jgi:hypothetical protein
MTMKKQDIKSEITEKDIELSARECHIRFVDRDWNRDEADIEIDSFERSVDSFDNPVKTRLCVSEEDLLRLLRACNGKIPQI